MSMKLYSYWRSTAAYRVGHSMVNAELLRLDKGGVYFANEYWRLLTVALVHGSLIHLLFNMYALWIIGPIVKPPAMLASTSICPNSSSTALMTLLTDSAAIRSTSRFTSLPTS